MPKTLLLLSFACAVFAASAACQPNLDIAYNGTPVPNGGTANVGTQAIGAANRVYFTFTNSGTSTCTVSGGVAQNSVNCTASSAYVPGAVATSSLLNGLLEVTPVSAGSFSVDWVITSNDPVDGSYTIHVMGTGAALADVRLRLGATECATGIPGTTVNAGIVNLGSSASLTFTVDNNVVAGSPNLLLTNGPDYVTTQGTTNCTVSITQPATTTLAPAASTSFLLQLTPPATGSFSASMRLHSNDPDEANLDFLITGNCVIPANPEIGLSRGASPISSGGTDSAGAASPGVGVTFVYTVSNTGTDPLSFGGSPWVVLSGQTNCTATLTGTALTQVPLAPGTTTTFGVIVTPTGSAPFSVQISIPNDDANENPYIFTIAGAAAAPGGGDTGGKDVEGCSTAAGSSWFMALPLLALGALVRRRRRA